MSNYIAFYLFEKGIVYNEKIIVVASDNAGTLAMPFLATF